MRSAACRRGRRTLGLASYDLCSSLHHLISGRTVLARTHIPHACGEEATRMRPIYETALLALGWHGHHPSRADRGRCRDADAFVKSLRLHRLEHRPCGHKTGCEVAPKRHHQLARQGHNGNAPDARAGIERALPEPLAELAARLMPQPQPGQFDRGAAGARIARLANPLVAIGSAALPWTGRQPEIARDLAPVVEVLVERLLGQRRRERRA